ncbi:MAG: hypothetical protein RLZZ153_404, partial [Pseudomonadota bacterium]
AAGWMDATRSIAAPRVGGSDRVQGVWGGGGIMGVRPVQNAKPRRLTQPPRCCRARAIALARS